MQYAYLGEMDASAKEGDIKIPIVVLYWIVNVIHCQHILGNAGV